MNAAEVQRKADYEKQLSEAVSRLTAPGIVEQMEKRRKDDELHQFRSEVEVSPVRCKCGGVGVLMHDKNDKDWAWSVYCCNCVSSLAGWFPTKEEALAEWSKQNEEPKEPELAACPCGAKAQRSRIAESRFVINCVERDCMWEVEGHTQEEADAFWNRRAVPAGDAELEEALSKAIGCLSAMGPDFPGRLDALNALRKAVAKRYPEKQ